MARGRPSEFSTSSANNNSSIAYPPFKPVEDLSSNKQTFHEQRSGGMREPADPRDSWIQNVYSQEFSQDKNPYLGQQREYPPYSRISDGGGTWKNPAVPGGPSGYQQPDVRYGQTSPFAMNNNYD